MNYTKEHAQIALEIIERLSKHVKSYKEYEELKNILREPSRWKEAHMLFSKIRRNITLPKERKNDQSLDSYFVYVAECAAKTAYNCSNPQGGFDDDSFEWLLKCEQEFLNQLKEN